MSGSHFGSNGAKNSIKKAVTSAPVENIKTHCNAKKLPTESDTTTHQLITTEKTMQPIKKQVAPRVNNTKPEEKKLDYIIGVVSNEQRSLSGKVIASTTDAKATQAIKANLAEAVTVKHPNAKLNGHKQVALRQLNTAESYRLFLNLGEDYHVPVHPERKLSNLQYGGVLEHFTASTWFAPILPRMFQNHQLSLEGKNLGAPTTGFLYLFVGGHLWREVGIETNEDTGSYQLKEINLEKDWGLSSRETVIDLADDSILVPQLINNELVTDVQIAHSMVQWSWQHIQSMGGLHPEDTRVQGREQQKFDPKKAAALRKGRLQVLNELLPWETDATPWYQRVVKNGDALSNLPQIPLLNPIAIALSHVTENLVALKELQETYNKLPDKNPHYASGEVLHRLVFDPSLWEREGSLDYDRLYAEIVAPFDGRFPHLFEYRAYLEKIFPDRTSGIINNKMSEYLAVRRKPGYRKRDKGAEFLRDLRDNLDESKLSQCLFPTEIKEKITALDDARKKHFSWLKGEAAKGSTQRVLGKRNIPFHSALADYANLDAGNEDNNWMEFINLWMKLIIPLHSKKTAVSDLYDLMDERRSPRKTALYDPGTQWINSIINDQGHPIYNMLFPAEGIMDASQTYDDPACLPEVDFDGSGCFRPKEFAKAVALAMSKAESEGVGPATLSDAEAADIATANSGKEKAAQSAVGSELFSKDQKILALPLRILSDFFNWAGALLDPSVSNKDYAVRTQKISTFVRLGQASQIPDLKGLHLVKKGAEVDTQRFIVLGANELRTEQLNTKATSPDRVAAFKADSGGGAYTDLVDGRTGKKIGSTLLSQEMNWYKGATPPKPGATFDAQALWSQTGADRGRGVSKVTATVTVLAVERTDYLARQRANWAIANNNVADSPGAQYKLGIGAARTANAFLSVFMLHYEVMTLMSIKNGSLDDRSKGQYATALMVAGISLIAAIGEATMATATLLGKHTFSKLLNNLSFGELGFNGRTVNLRVFKVFGTAASSITSVLSAIDAWEHLKRSDYDAAATLAVGALVGGTLAAIGVGALFGLGWALAVPNPVVWALIALSIAIALLAAYFRDKPLPDWVLHGPFGKEAFDGDYKVWKEKPKDCYKALMSQLLRPSLELEEGVDPQTKKKAIVATMDVPFFTPKVDEIRVHTTLSSFSFRSRQDGGKFGQGAKSKNEFSLTPYKIIQNSDETGTQIDSVSYFYDYPERGEATIARHKLKARAQMRTAGMTIPAPYKPGLYKDLPKVTPIKIDADDQLDWVHIEEPLKIRQRK